MKWNVLLGIVLSVGFVLGILYQVDFTQLLTALQSVRPVPLALALFTGTGQTRADPATLFGSIHRVHGQHAASCTRR
jgi:hypothetical protein